MLKKLIALATIDAPHHAEGTAVEFEITVEAVRHRTATSRKDAVLQPEAKNGDGLDADSLTCFFRPVPEGMGRESARDYGMQRAALLEGSIFVPPGLSRYATWQCRHASATCSVTWLTAS